MYPLAIIFIISAIRGRHEARWYGIPFVIMGIGLSAYHVFIEQFPSAASAACSTIAPCNSPPFIFFGFITLAYMALSAFVFIGIVIVVDMIYVRRCEKEYEKECSKELQREKNISKN